MLIQTPPTRSTACVVYELIELKKPYEGTNADEVLTAICGSESPQLTRNCFIFNVVLEK